MKNKKTILSLSTFLGTCVLFLLISTAAWAASPVIFYSDLTSGPNTGGQNSLGAFVTIWGNNFGSTQGASTVTVGGGAVANIQAWSNTMICFQLGSGAATGNIVVSVSGVSSNGIPFTVRSGNIYFVNPAAGTNGTGTYASPFNHIYYAYSKPVVAGDTVYVMSGTISNQMEGYPGYHSLLCVNTSGTQTNPIAWVA
ncbi:MAG: IPT/TIG domain-containing protein, partial [Candidatus Omnitrophica bacterium]|nr:IPT/TIG domain-containing protein [Candidatus Omnitrophota bacterium]